MSARSAFSAAVFLAALAAAPARAQEPSPDPEPQAPAPAPVVERARAERSERRDSAVSVRAPRIREDNGTQEARPRARTALDAPAPASTPAPAAFDDDQQGGRRRPSGGGGGGSARGGGSGGRSAGGDNGARPRGGVRSGDDNGGNTSGQAVPRTRAPRSGGNYYAPSYSRRYYSAGALGYYFYDPWSWYAGPGYGWGGYYGSRWGGYYGGYGGYYGGYGAYGGPYGWSVGGVRFKVEPKDAEVYVDGYYAGIIDDFDGLWQQLRLDEGGYHIEVRKTGLETLTFDVMVQPGRTITYRGRMTP